MTSVVRQVSQLCLHVDHVSTSKSSLLAAFSKRKDVELISGEAPARTSYLRYDLHACFYPMIVDCICHISESVGWSQQQQPGGGRNRNRNCSRLNVSTETTKGISLCQRSSKNRAFPFNLKTTLLLGLQKNYPLRLTHKNTI